MLLVFGSLSGDHVAHVPTLPCPGETTIAHAYKFLPGGKGANQAVAAAYAGADVVMCGSVGDDAAGVLSRRALQEAGVRCEGLRTVDVPTGLAFVWVEHSGENVISIAQNANAYTRAEDVTDALLRGPRHALVQMEVRVDETWRFLQRAHDAGVVTVCNLAPQRPIPDAAWHSLDWLIVNAHEAASLVGGVPSTEAMQTLAAQRQTNMVITEGADGARAVTPTQAWHVQALKIQPVDTTGAGDAFVGAFTAQLDAQASIQDALRYASAAGGLACASVGAQSALRRDADIRAAARSIAAPRLLRQLA